MVSTYMDEPDDEDVKLVFAHFGRTYYQSEVLHRGLCNLYAARMMPTMGGTRPRIEELQSQAFRTTLGALVEELRPLVDLPLGIDEAVRRRNYVAHHFWFEQVHRLTSRNECRRLVEELEADADLFRESDQKIEVLHEQELQRLGLLNLFQDVLPSWMAAPQAVEPLPQVRKLKKQERLLAVYDVPTDSGGQYLVFELDDHTLWQLCEVGLSWSVHDRKDEGWRHNEKFDGFLPATISPRPTVTSPWNFEIHLTGKGSLRVWCKSNDGIFRWTIRVKR